jgi:peptide/nickel transport system permease protein
MGRMILSRVAVSVFVLWGATTIMFVLIRLAPGDPATILLGSDATQEEIAVLRTRLGLDANPLVQYFAYYAQLFRLDFGESFRNGIPAMAVVLDRLPATLELTLAATLIAISIGLTLGLVASRRPDGVIDRIVSTIAILFQGMPTFWVGIMLILVFALTLRLLPSSGAGSPAHLVLPAVTLALPFTAIVARLSRATLTEAMREPYIQTALAKGLSRTEALRDHALRNALGPVATIVGLQVGTLLGGAVVVENVFAWPGLGTLIVQSVSYRDYAVVQAAVLLIALLVLILNLAADVANASLDPRIRVGGRS